MARPRLARLRGGARPLTPFAVATAIVAIAVAAIALPRHHTDLRDPNDTKGKLDVREVRLDHEGGTELTVLTFATWTAHAIWDQGNAYVFVDTKGDEAAEYFVLVRSTGSTLQGSLWRDRRDRRDVYLRNVAVRRKSPNGVTVAVPIKALGFGRARESYFWWTVTSFTGDTCRRTCIDRAPDRGAVEQWRPGMSPDPTTTGSPTSG